MQITIPGRGGVDYDEKIPGSPVYTFANGQSHVERTFTCAWQDRVLLIQGLLGYPKIVNVGGGGGQNASYIARILPDAMPDFVSPSNLKDSWLYASSVVRCIGVGETGNYDPTGVSEYQESEVTIAYEPRTYRIRPDSDLPNSKNWNVPDESCMYRYITRIIKPSAEFVSLPRGLMHWNDGKLDNKGNFAPTPLEFATARLIPSAEIAYTWHEVPFIPDALLMKDGLSSGTFIGCLNLYPFTDGIPGQENTSTFNPGTLLLLSADIKPYRHASGAFVHDITYRMKYLEPQTNRGHNFFLRWVQGTSDLVYTKITTDGYNDYVAIPADKIKNSPYNPQTKPSGDTAVGKSSGVYGYAGFGSLFTKSIANPDQIVGR